MGPEQIKKFKRQAQLMKVGGDMGPIMVMMDEFLSSVKTVTVQGNPGKTPQVGKDFFTEAQKAQFVKDILALIRPPQDGKTPVAGQDYPTLEQVQAMVQKIPLPEVKHGQTPIRGVHYFTQEDVRMFLDILEKDMRAYAEQLLKDAQAAQPPVVTRLPVIELFGGRGGGSRIRFLNNGQSFEDIQTVDLISGVTVTRRAPGYLGLAFSGGSSVGHTIEDEGVPLAQRTNLNFVGAGVTVTDDAGNDATVVTIPGGGSGGPTFYDNETPTGAFDGSNAAFTLAHTPDAGTLKLFLNGQFLTAGVDYTLSVATITFITVPAAAFAGLPFKAFYRQGSGTFNFADNETPSGTINGSNASFTLAHAPSPTDSLQLYLNGQIQTQGVDYTLVGTTITFVTAPDVGFSGLPFKAFYRY
jgi:hypothetical protein